MSLDNGKILYIVCLTLECITYTLLILLKFLSNFQVSSCSIFRTHLNSLKLMDHIMPNWKQCILGMHVV